MLGLWRGCGGAAVGCAGAVFGAVQGLCLAGLRVAQVRGIPLVELERRRHLQHLQSGLGSGV